MGSFTIKVKLFFGALNPANIFMSRGKRYVRQAYRHMGKDYDKIIKHLEDFEEKFRKGVSTGDVSEVNAEFKSICNTELEEFNEYYTAMIDLIQDAGLFVGRLKNMYKYETDPALKMKIGKILDDYGKIFEKWLGKSAGFNSLSIQMSDPKIKLAEVRHKLDPMNMQWKAMLAARIFRRAIVDVIRKSKTTAGTAKNRKLTEKETKDLEFLVEKAENLIRGLDSCYNDIIDIMQQRRVYFHKLVPETLLGLLKKLSYPEADQKLCEQQWKATEKQIDDIITKKLSDQNNGLKRMTEEIKRVR